MPLNIAQVEDAIIAGREKANEIMDRVEKSFLKPLDDVRRAVYIKQFLNAIPQPVMDQLRERVPGAVNQLEKQYGGTNGKTRQEPNQNGKENNRGPQGPAAPNEPG